MSEGMTVTLVSSDGKSTFTVDEVVACESELVKNTIEDCGTGSENIIIPLPVVSKETLVKVIEYCKYHVEAMNLSKDKLTEDEIKAWENEIKAWDENFVTVDQQTLYDLINAANYLNINKLLDLTCHAVADMIRCKDPDEIRRIFGILNDFNPEEEKEVRMENQWAFE